MHQLLPIIRRKRRPLVMSDAPPVVVGNVEPVNALARPARTAEEAKQVDGQNALPLSPEETD